MNKQDSTQPTQSVEMVEMTAGVAGGDSLWVIFEARLCTEQVQIPVLLLDIYINALSAPRLRVHKRIHTQVRQMQ